MTSADHIRALAGFCREVNIASRWLKEPEIQAQPASHAAVYATMGVAAYMLRDHEIEVELLVRRELTKLFADLHLAYSL